MNSISVLIVEDDLIEALRLENSLADLGFKVLPGADNVKDALGIFYSTNPDIVILDINLKGNKDGIELGGHITSNRQYEKPIIYLTSIQDSQMFERAKATNPHAYLIKPVDPRSLQRTIELALHQFAGNKYGFLNDSLEHGIINRESIFVKKGKKMVRVRIDDIKHIEVESKYCTLFADGEKYLIRISLIDLLGMLSPAIFQRVNRNIVVNLNKVNEFDLEDMTVSVGESLLPISKKYKKELLTKLSCLQ